ncbi:MAG TPA: gamma-glutamyltransferase, partial [Thermomicrobiales bacterium]|nr:gamma-glutamyltransferase [Thermomicrobiales bacterium]
MTIAQGPRTSERPPIQARSYAVASGHYLATEAAMRTFRRGGNAIDAGVAAGICIDVLLPDLCSFGGVAPIIIHHASSGETLSISGLGKWGASASLQHFIDHEDGKLPIGAKRSIVPGAPDSWLTALARYGRLTFAEVVQPAIELCEGGFVVYPSLHRNIAKARNNIAQWKSSSAIFLPQGNAPAVGSVLFQKDLAKTFRRMTAAEAAVDGRGRVAGIDAARDEFYRGDIGKEIAEFIQSEGGSVGEEDLANFHSEIEEPPGTSFHGVDVRVCGPWSQGPVIPQTLNIIEEMDLAGMGHNSVDYIHVVTEAMNLAFSDREHHYGDPNYVYVPIDQLLSKEYAAQRRERIDLARAFGEMPDPGGSGNLADAVRQRSPAQADTSYVCAIDDEGNAFSATPSDGIGSTPIIPGLGLICSGRGSQSWIDPDHPSSLHPGKRPRLTPNPAMAFKDGKL